MIAAISLTAVHPARNVARPDTCPAHGGISIKRGPPLARLEELGVPAMEGSAGTRKLNEAHLKHHGCIAEFVHDESNIKTTMKDFLVQPNMPAQIKHCYKKQIRESDHLTRHRPAITQGANAKRSMLGASVVKKGMPTCLMYEGVKTPGSFVRVTNSDRCVHYAFAELGME